MRQPLVAFGIRLGAPPAILLSPILLLFDCSSEHSSALRPRDGACRVSLCQVFSMKHLKVFTAEELELHIRGDIEAWDLDTLRARCALNPNP